MWPFTRKPKPPKPVDWYEVTKNGREEYFVYIHCVDDEFSFCLNRDKPFQSFQDAEKFIKRLQYIQDTNKEIRVYP